MSDVRISRKSLLITALTMLPSFLVGEWAASKCGFHSFSLHDVCEGFWGAMILAGVLILTNSEERR